MTCPHCEPIAEHAAHTAEVATAASRRAFLLERILRDLSELEGDISLNAVVKVLQARLVTAEQNIERLVKERGR